MSTSQIVLVDPYEELSDEFLQHPYPVYEQLRNQAPIFQGANGKHWLVSRYSDVSAILRDQRFSSERYTGQTSSTAMMQDPRFQAVRKSQSNWMIMRDEPDHTRLRSLVNKAFTPSTVDNLRAHIEQIVDQLLSEIEEKQVTDLIADYAFLLPVTVIARMLGVPVEDHAMFSRWSRALTAASDVRLQTERLLGANEAAEGLSDYFRTMVEKRRKDPQNDVISALVAAEEQGKSLTTEEVIDNSIMLLFGGHETTVNLIGNGTLALLRNPDQLERLRRDPALIKTGVEELLRYDSPVQYIRRTIKEDLVLDGAKMKQFEMVIVMLGSANRDPQQFPNPDQLDLSRSDNRHVALGGGTHFCLGASLARLEAEIAFLRLIARFPNLRLASNDVRYKDSAAFRGLTSLPLTT